MKEGAGVEDLWNDAEARAAIERYGAKGVSEDLALRTYSARLLGREPRLVLHGGGNTSVKTRQRDIFGDEVDVLCVKGSGWDLSAIEPAGHPAVRLAPLMKLRARQTLGDEDMVSVQRQCLLDAAAPNPSVETLLHAYIPDKFVDHTHSTAILAIADQPDAEELFRGIFGDRLACVPYVMPGFALAKAAGSARDANPQAQGLVLLQHGIFTYGATARQSYQRMIACVQAAEAFLDKMRRPPRATPARSVTVTAVEHVLPQLRGALASAAGDRWPGRWILDLRATPLARSIADDERLEELAKRGVATPDHVIRTKDRPLVVPHPTDAMEAWRRSVDSALGRFVSDYGAYFTRNNARLGGGKIALDPLPRVLAVPGLGLIGVGKTSSEAAVAADIAESWAETLRDAEAIGRFQPVGESDTFDMEYWSLEQAKLGKAAEKRLARHVVMITGAGGAIGAAVAKAFAAEGAEIAALDLDGAAAVRTAASVGKAAVAVTCDVTDPASVTAAFARTIERFGGIDIVVSNAGAAWTGRMADLDDAVLRKSFELNFFAHQLVAQMAVRAFRGQGMGGVLLFNASKQAINPGPDFGAYGSSKAALLALVRQYALEHGGDGVRCNAVNADRVRSGLLTDEMIQARSASRGMTTNAYMSGNLLGREVLPEDVAQAFVFAAMMQKTTGAIFPVDGGNVPAMLR